MLSLKTMLYVVTTAKMCSFTKAADTLYVSQSSISQAIKALEEELNTTLFVRQNNKIFLTKAGEIFVNEAEKLLERSDLLQKRITEMSDETQRTIHFGLSSFYSKYYMPSLISHLDQKLQNVSFGFTEDISYNLEDMVSSDMLDFCLVPLPIAHQDLSAVSLKQEQILLAVPPRHPIALSTEPGTIISLKSVKDEPFVFLKAFQRFTDLGMKLCKQCGFLPNIIYESMNWETIDALVGKGIGVSLVPDVVTHVHGTQKPVYYPIDSELASRTYALAFKSNRQKDAEFQSIVTLIQSIFQSMNEQT